jgi:hypothetical protein
MILHRHSAEGRGARLAHPWKGELRLRLVLLLTATPLALALALALAATLLPRGLSHAADSIPVEWIPGDIQNIQDRSGCHAQQDATIKASTPELARQITDQVNLVKEKVLWEHGLKLTSISKTDVSGDSVALEIQTWYDDECPGPSASALQPGTTAEIQPASFQNASFQSAGRQNAGLQRAGAVKWVKAALAGLATGAVYTTVLMVVLGVIAAVAPEAAGALVAVLAGCVAGAAAGVIGAAIFAGDWNDSLVSALVGCTWGAILGPLAHRASQLLYEVLRGFGSAAADTASYMGQGAAGAAREAGLELQPVSSVLTTTGQEVLRAAR